MSLFRPSHFPLGVIGIASCSQADSLSSIIAEFNAAVKDLFPPDSMYPLAKNCFVFEEADGTTNLNLGDHLPGLVIIPSMMGNKKENIETLLADLCSNVLAEFSTVVRAIALPPCVHVF
jgi:trafficking protein particle complex subunit 9